MSWATGKAALAARLATITITEPVALTTDIVYPTPPAALTTDICWVLFPPAVEPERIPGGWRRNNYRYRARLFVMDGDAEFAALIVENVVEATIAAFDNQAALRTGGIQHINGPSVREPGQFQFSTGAPVWHIADCVFDIDLGEAKTFG